MIKLLPNRIHGLAVDMRACIHLMFYACKSYLILLSSTLIVRFAVDMSNDQSDRYAAVSCSLLHIQM